MTDQDIIKACAELDGWLDVKVYTFDYDYCGEKGQHIALMGRDPKELQSLKYIRDYLESYDAIIPLVNSQNWSKSKPFVRYLMEGINTEAQTIEKLSYLDISRLICASPKQLAIALVKAAGKWKE